MYENTIHDHLPAGYKIIWSNRTRRVESTTVASSLNEGFHHRVETSHHRSHDFSGKQEAILRKLTAQHIPDPGPNGHDSYDFEKINVEEMVIYFLLIILLVYVFTHIIKCVRITLDPYNTSARGAWMETLEKRDSKFFSNLGLRTRTSSST